MGKKEFATAALDIKKETYIVYTPITINLNPYDNHSLQASKKNINIYQYFHNYLRHISIFCRYFFI